ncbi:MAG: DUF1282 family protein [Gammaproteobacteria bacterium]|nr:DUF1282 family protein [Gammaproteobacteria bacterium]
MSLTSSDASTSSNPVSRVFKVLFDTENGWRDMRSEHLEITPVLLGHTIPFALIAPLCGFYGTTVVGWSIGTGPHVKMTTGTALPITLLFFIATITAVLCVAKAIQWMAQTYCDPKPFGHCLALASYTATPLFLVGLAQLYPLLWLNLVVGLPALAYTVRLFYVGVPIMMDIDRERGFLFATAALCFGLVTLVAMMVATVLLWGAGLAPEFTY